MTDLPDNVFDNLPDEAFYAYKIAMAVGKLNDFYGTSVALPAVTWDLVGKSRAGEASGDATTIRLNRQYAVLMGRTEYTQTALHEAAHIVTSARRIAMKIPHQSDGQWSSHGYQWARAMEQLGLSPDRCVKTTAEVSAAIRPARLVRKVHATCNCEMGHEVTVAVANKIGRGARYTCRGCKTHITID